MRAGRGFLACAAMLLALAGLMVLIPADSHAAESSCVTCHRDLDDERLTPPVEDWALSVHSEGGIGCESCHGGDPTIEDVDAMATDDYIGVPSVKQIPDLCGACHSDPDKMRKYNLRVDEFDLFKRSGHGRALYERGDTRVATCVNCHGMHKILSKKDRESLVYYANIPRTCGTCHSNAEYMAGYGLSTDQEERYNKSYHAQIMRGEIPGKNPALAPTCASCHTHSPLLPGATEVPEICGRCHSVTAKYFKDSLHYVALNEAGVPRCVDCHGNHEILYPGIEMFSSEAEGHCGSCHDLQSAEYGTGQQIRSLLDGSLEKVGLMKEQLDRLEHSGRNLSDLQTLLEESQTYLTEAIPITHTLSVERIQEKTDHATSNADAFFQKVNAFQAELRARKRNLGIILGVVAVNICFLWLKRRSLHRA